MSFEYIVRDITSFCFQLLHKSYTEASVENIAFQESGKSKDIYVIKEKCMDDLTYMGRGKR